MTCVSSKQLEVKASRAKGPHPPNKTRGGSRPTSSTNSDRQTDRQTETHTYRHGHRHVHTRTHTHTDSRQGLQEDRDRTLFECEKRISHNCASLVAKRRWFSWVSRDNDRDSEAVEITVENGA